MLIPISLLLFFDDLINRDNKTYLKQKLTIFRYKILKKKSIKKIEELITMFSIQTPQKNVYEINILTEATLQILNSFGIITVNLILYFEQKM